MDKLDFKELRELLKGTGFKLMDVRRKSVLSLPASAFLLWETYYLNEDDDQESYLSDAQIEAQNKMSKPTIIKWTRYLVEHRWLIDTGKTAADKFKARGLPATRGAHTIVVYRVDDPTTIKSGGKESLPVKNLYPPKDLTQGFRVSSSVYGSGSPSHSNSPSASLSLAKVSEGQAPFEKPASKPESQTVEPTPKPKANPARGRSKGKVKGKTALDGTPWPEDFNLWPSNADRLAWLTAHNDIYERIDRDMKRDMAELAEGEAEYDEQMEKLMDEATVNWVKMAKIAGTGHASAAKRSGELSTKQERGNPKTKTDPRHPHPSANCERCGQAAVVRKTPHGNFGELLCQNHYDREKAKMVEGVNFQYLMLQVKGAWVESKG